MLTVKRDLGDEARPNHKSLVMLTLSPCWKQGLDARKFKCYHYQQILLLAFLEMTRPYSLTNKYTNKQINK